MFSWRSAKADDAEWMFGKSRNRLAPVLTEASSWMSDRRAQVAFGQATRNGMHESGRSTGALPDASSR